MAKPAKRVDQPVYITRRRQKRGHRSQTEIIRDVFEENPRPFTVDDMAYYTSFNRNSVSVIVSILCRENIITPVTFGARNRAYRLAVAA